MGSATSHVRCWLETREQPHDPCTLIPETATLHIQFHIVERGQRKEMHLPGRVRPHRKADDTLGRALARAFCWKRTLESGEFSSIAELAEQDGIASSYMTRVLRLTLLAPDIFDAILDKKQRLELTLARVLEPFPAAWNEQRPRFQADTDD